MFRNQNKRIDEVRGRPTRAIVRNREKTVQKDHLSNLTSYSESGRKSPPQFARLSTEEAKAVLTARGLPDSPVVRQQLEWVGSWRSGMPRSDSHGGAIKLLGRILDYYGKRMLNNGEIKPGGVSSVPYGETIHPAGQASPWKSQLGKAASARSSCCYRVRNASPTLRTHEANMYRFSGVTELVRAE
jgi:hypothetical protein